MQPAAAPAPLVPGQPADATGVAVVTVDLLRVGRPGRELTHRRAPCVLDHGHAHGGEQRLTGEGEVASRLRAVVARAVPGPRRQMHRVARAPLDPLPVDLGPAPSCDDEHHGVPGVPVHRRDDAGVDLVREGVHRAGRSVAVRTDVHPGAGPAGGLQHHRVLERHHGLLVAAPLLDEIGAALLLHVVVRDLRGGAGRHDSPRVRKD